MNKRLKSYIHSFINPNLGGGGVILPSPCWFSINNSEIVKAATMEIYI